MYKRQKETFIDNNDMRYEIAVTKSSYMAFVSDGKKYASSNWLYTFSSIVNVSVSASRRTKCRA